MELFATIWLIISVLGIFIAIAVLIGESVRYSRTPDIPQVITVIIILLIPIVNLIFTGLFLYDYNKDYIRGFSIIANKMRGCVIFLPVLLLLSLFFV